jgi:hypothetical protein
MRVTATLRLGAGTKAASLEMEASTLWSLPSWWLVTGVDRRVVVVERVLRRCFAAVMPRLQVAGEDGLGVEVLLVTAGAGAGAAVAIAAVSPFLGVPQPHIAASFAAVLPP